MSDDELANMGFSGQITFSGRQGLGYMPMPVAGQIVMSNNQVYYHTGTGAVPISSWFAEQDSAKPKRQPSVWDDLYESFESAGKYKFFTEPVNEPEELIIPSAANRVAPTILSGVASTSMSAATDAFGKINWEPGWFTI